VFFIILTLPHFLKQSASKQYDGNVIHTQTAAQSLSTFPKSRDVSLHFEYAAFMVRMNCHLGSETMNESGNLT